MKLTDCHTHKIPVAPELSVYAVTEPVCPTDGIFFSAGIHPMFAESAEMPESYIPLLRSPQCLAVGECGLDRRAKLPLKEQEQLFRRHILLAEELHKPLVIHAVRTRLEIIRLHKEFQPTVPWILHGCRGTAEHLTELAELGFILSFGEGLLRDAGSLELFFDRLPERSLLIETDESAVSPDVLYSAAASYRRMNREDFADLIYRNFRRIFHHEC